MKIDWSFPIQVLLALIVIGMLGAYPVLMFGSAEVTRAALVGALLTTINVLLGYFAIEYSIGKSMTTFLKYVLGGMGIRLALMAISLVILIKVFNFNVPALVGSMGVFYIVFLALEVFFIQKRLGLRQQG